MEIIEILKAMCNKKDAQSLERLLKDKTTKEVENILRNIEYNEHRFRLLVSEKTYKHILNAVQLGRRLYCMPGSPGTQVSSVKDAANLFSHIMWENQERFVIAILNCKNIVLETRTVSIGTANETLASPRDIFREVIRHGATRMIIAHNHPSGNLDPSQADLELTKQLLLGAQLLNIPILDHLILGNGNYRSLRENTSLWIDFPQED